MFSIRSIFLALRGIYMGRQAMKDAQKDVETLKDKQERLANVGYRLMFAGAAFTAFGFMVNRAMMGLFEHTSRGERVLSDFEKVFDRVKSALAERIIDMFGEQIQSWIRALDELSRNEFLTNIMAGIIVTLGPITMTAGAFLTAAGVGAMLTNNLITLFRQVTGLRVWLGTKGVTGAAAKAALTGGIGQLITLGVGTAVAVYLTGYIAEFIWQITPESFKEKFDEALKAQLRALEAQYPGLLLDIGVQPNIMRIGGVGTPYQGYLEEMAHEETKVYITIKNTGDVKSDVEVEGGKVDDYWNTDWL